jgi:hypothetical protein
MPSTRHSPGLPAFGMRCCRYGSGDVFVGAKLLVQPGKALFEHFAKRIDAFTVDPASPVVGSNAVPCDLQVLPL